MTHEERDKLMTLLPAFKGLTVRQEKGRQADMADYIAKAEGRAVTLRARDLIAIAERIKQQEEALLSATTVDLSGLGTPDPVGGFQAALDRLSERLDALSGCYCDTLPRNAVCGACTALGASVVNAAAV